MPDRKPELQICVSGAFRDIAHLSNFLERHPDVSQDDRFLVELRLDLLEGSADDLCDFIDRYRSKLVVSCRLRTEGGRWNGTEAERTSLLAMAAGHGPRLVDLDLHTWMKGGGEHVRRACRGGCQVMVSAHEFGQSSFFIETVKRLNSTGAAAVKLAGITRDSGDLVSLASASECLNAPIRSVVGMGPAGAFSRARPTAFNSSMTYASAGPGLETADGQPPYDTLMKWRCHECAKLEPVALIGGEQVARSPGPDIYNHLFSGAGINLQYLALPASGWNQALKALSFFGIRRFAVTMPFKLEPCAKWPDAERDDIISMTGVVNTVVMDGDRASLSNTDAEGVKEILYRLGGAADRSVLVLGGGATSRSVAAAALSGGAHVTVAVRNRVPVSKSWPSSMAGDKGVTFKGWERRGDGVYDIVVNTTPLGADGKSVPLDSAGLRAVLGAVDAVVLPSGRTPFISAAVRQGLRVAEGLDFWCAQAPAQLSRFCGVNFSFDEVTAAMKATGHAVAGVMAAAERPGPGFDLEPVDITVPGSKSLTQRYLVLAALSRYPVRILHPSTSRDCLELERALAMLGTRTGRAPGSLDVYPAGHLRDPGRVIPTGEGGTTFRFLSALSLLCDFPLKLQPSGSMKSRPVTDLFDSLGSLGVSSRREGEATVFEKIRSEANRTSVKSDVSSQFLSALLLAGSGMEKGLTIEAGSGMVSRPYIDMTVSAIRLFGGEVAQDGCVYRVAPGTGRPGLVADVEYDASLAAFWDAASMIYGRSIRVTNRGPAESSTQGDAAFSRLAARISGEDDVSFDLTDTPDLLPPLMLPALFRRGRTTFTGMAHVRTKESDRVDVLASSLGQLGGNIEQGPDSLVVVPCRLSGPAVMDPRGDHRMAMFFGILSLMVSGLKIIDPECVDKSYPAFWQDLEKVRN